MPWPSYAAPLLVDKVRRSVKTNEGALDGAWPFEAAFWAAGWLILVVADFGTKEVRQAVGVEGGDQAVVALVPRLLLPLDWASVDYILSVDSSRDEVRRLKLGALEGCLGDAREDVVVHLGGADSLVVSWWGDPYRDAELRLTPFFH